VSAHDVTRALLAQRVDELLEIIALAIESESLLHTTKVEAGMIRAAVIVRAHKQGDA